MWQLQGLDVEQFLAEYWQRKPLLIRQAFPDFDPMLSPEELAGLACEEGVHARLVVEKDAASPWQLRYGPFKESDFTSLPESHYSLLVSECEKWMPPLRDLLAGFDFIPRWRIDDLMISYAPDQGSVGPHIDEYDVFLIQAAGTRRWSIESQANPQPELIPNLDLAIMQQFDSDQDWLLEPGDMLYLPAHIPHHGVAVGDGCMTWSVGFRAPALGDIADSFMLESDRLGLTGKRYRDGDLRGPRHPAEITAQDISHFRQMMYRMLDDSHDLWPRVVGCLVSDIVADDRQANQQLDSFRQVLAASWERQEDSRVYYFKDSESIILFYNGQSSSLDYNVSNIAFCQRLCGWHSWNPDDWEPFDDDNARTVFVELVNAGVMIRLQDDDV
jgi:50S ribosomal protein L16 3-hydroxylase